jgi:hypothetical protein
VPYAINQNDIIEVKVQMAQSQIVEMYNTLHYRYVDEASIADGADALADFLATFGNPAATDGFHTRWKALASDLVQIDKYHAQRVYPVRYARVTLDVAQAGAVAANPLPGCCQITFWKRGEIAARYAVGGVRIGGIADDQEEGSELTAGAQANAALLANSLKLEIVTTAGRHWKPIVYRRLNPGSSVLVANTGYNKIVSTQRTRIAFRGV